MASIGELTATVRADVSGFVGPMQQVVTTTQRTASQVQSITAPTQRWSELLGQTATAGRGATTQLNSLRGTLASLASTAAGIPGPLGNLASKLALFSVGGGLTVAVLAGLAAIAAAFRRGSEEADRQAQTVEDLANAYREMSGEAHRARLAIAQTAVGEANRNTHFGIGRRTIDMGRFGVTIPTLGQVRDLGAVAEANAALLAAEKALADFEAGQATTARRRLTEATREAQRAVEEFDNALKSSKDKGATNTTEKVELVRTEAKAWKELKAAIDAAIQTERDRDSLLPGKPKGGDKSGTEQAVQGARDAAQAMAQAFMAAFTESKEAIGDRIASVLRSAIQGAIQRLIEEKLFDALLKAFAPDKGIVSGGILPNIPIIGGILGGLGLAPPMPAAGGTIIVPLDALPPALSPVEVARDVQHQTLWMETARVAEANGFRLVPRFR